MPFEHAADNLRKIIFQTWSRTPRSALPALNIGHQILLRKLQTCRYTIEHDTYKVTVRLAENAYSIFSSECIHNFKAVYNDLRTCSHADAN